MNRRAVIAIVLLCCAISVQAQWQVDSLKRQTWQQLDEKYNHPVFALDQHILDNQSPRQQLATLAPKDAAYIDVIRSTSNPALYGTKDYTVVYVITKSFAKKEYQKKLSAFSTDYRNYLEAHSNNDDEVQYILNTQLLKNDSDELFDLFNKLSPEKITNVAFTGVKGKKTLIIDIKFDE